MLVQTPYGLGEVVFKGETLAKVRIPSYLPKSIKPQDNPEREYWFWADDVAKFPTRG